MVCQLCSKVDFEFYTIVNKNIIFPNSKELKIFRCKNCNLFQIHPLIEQDQLNRIYINEGVFSKIIENPAKDKKFFKFFEKLYSEYGLDERFIVKKCFSFFKEKKELMILDIGCSTGNLLKIFRNYEPNVRMMGIDIDPNSKKNAAPEIQESIIIGDFLNVEFQNLYDIISFNTVVEHLPNFVKYLEKAKSILNTDGIIFISTPDILSPQSLESGDKWELISTHEKMLGHVIWLNKPAINFLAKKLDLKIVLLQNRGSAFFHFPKILRRLIVGIFGWGPRSRPIKNYYLRIIYAIFFDGIFSEKFSYGEILYVILKK